MTLIAVWLALASCALALTHSACADESARSATGDTHRYTLRECLALTERNHPAIEAARARLAVMRAQVDEARAAPWSSIGLSTQFGVIPSSPPASAANAASAASAATTASAPSFSSGIGPFLQVGVNATVPLYTFGKISSTRRAAEAQVRLGEWDVEKERQQVRTDVRRAYFGLGLARDMLQLGTETLAKLDDVLASLTKKLESGDPSVESAERLRMQASHDELVARMGEATRGEATAIAALRFYTGVQSGFDVPDEPLTAPSALRPVVQYLRAARLNRADINRARAGVAARDAQVDVARASFLPNIGLGLRFDYAVAPGVSPSASSSFEPAAANHLEYGAAFGIDWSLDFLTKAARLRQAKSSLDEAHALERLALGGAAAEVEAAYAAAVEASTRAESWGRAAHRAKGWIAAVRDAIDLGTKEESALVEPLRAFVLARGNELQALMDANVTRAELARLSGLEDDAPSS